MSKKQQLEIVKQSIQNGIETEVQEMIENINMGEIYEHHLINKFENGTFDKLDETDFENIVSNFDYQVEVKIHFHFNF